MAQKRARKLYTYDIETIKWNEYVIGSVYDGEKKFYADSASELCELMLSFCSHDKRKPYPVFYAHFGGKFDVKFILEDLLKKYGVSILPINGGLSMLKVYTDKRRKLKLCEIRDSYPLLPASLKNLARDFNVTQKLDVNRKRIDRLSREELEEYVSTDCVALYEVLIEAGKFVDLSRLTIASQAMAEWKTLESEDKYKSDARDDVFIRKSYYGGRTEVFKRKGTNLKYYDVNSMYPFAMSGHDYPAGRTIRVKRLVQGALGVYDVEVKTPESMKYPFLPYRDTDKRLLFPLGEWRGVYTSVEINKAVSLGYKFKVIEGIVWEEVARPFDEYVDKWHKIKTKASKEKKPALKYIAKLHLNSLYGKFGQRREFRRVVQGLEKWHLSRECLPLFPEQDLYTITAPDHRPHTFVQLASFVTSYARIQLYEGIQELESSGAEVYYADTDSLVTDGTMSEGDKLGEWELEKGDIDEGIFLLPKLYSLRSVGEGMLGIGYGETLRAKGMNKAQLSYSSYEGVLYRNEELKTTRDGIIGFYEAHRRGLSWLEVVDKSRVLKGDFAKRILLEDNITTKPKNIYNPTPTTLEV